MAVETTLICDGCGKRVASSRDGLRHAKADAHLNHGAAVTLGGGVRCRDCRKAAASSAGAPIVGHSVGTQR
jgi:ribosomal protein S27E